ncbi:MAG: hypothetical protein ACI8YQ_001412 [Polaribacter sp.]|jgi:hypothetical protein
MKKNNHIQYLFLVAALLLSTASCKKETTTIHNPEVDYIYNVNGENLYQSNADKNKEKSSEQYVSILYSNLFQDAIGQNDLVELSEIRRAIGDKQIADELILNAFVNNNNVQIPSNTSMRNDIDAFVEETYLRFFLRKPNPYETYELKSEIEEDTNLSPELIYMAFALSNEYKFY